jgi:hypothetical protein
VEATVNSDKRNDADEKRHYRQGAERTMNMVWTHEYNVRDEIARESTEVCTTGEE